MRLFPRFSSARSASPSIRITEKINHAPCASFVSPHARHRCVFSAFLPLANALLGTLGDRVPQGHDVLVRALTDASSEVRTTAVLTLNTLPVLVAALDDSSPDVRDAAVKRLARFGKSAIPAVDRLRMMLQDDEAVLRVESAIALQKITGRVESWPTLVEALNGDDYRTKVRALYAMRKFSPTELASVGDWLVELLASDEKSLPHLAAQTFAVMKDQAQPWLLTYCLP